MYEKILVPLDGSELAECALPHVENLAKGRQEAEVILLRVIEVEIYPIPKSYARSIDMAALRSAYMAETEQYLTEVQSRLAKAGLRARIEMVEGRAGQTISNYAREKGVDLIVIATHGYTGMRHLMFGSVALKVLHESQIPVLLIRPEMAHE